MKLCETCWEKMKKNINDRGLGHLVRKQPSGEEVMQALQGRMVKNPDPLVLAVMQLYGEAIGFAGPLLLVDNPDGTEKCPVCIATAGCTCTRGDQCHFKLWIDRVCDDAAKAVSKEVQA